MEESSVVYFFHPLIQTLDSVQTVRVVAHCVLALVEGTLSFGPSLRRYSTVCTYSKVPSMYRHITGINYQYCIVQYEYPFTPLCSLECHQKWKLECRSVCPSRQGILQRIRVLPYLEFWLTKQPTSCLLFLSWRGGTL